MATKAKKRLKRTHAFVVSVTYAGKEGVSATTAERDLRGLFRTRQWLYSKVGVTPVKEG